MSVDLTDGLNGHKEGVIASAAKQSENERMSQPYYVYIMTNEHDSVLYAGITSDLKKRVYEHREKLVAGFTKKYNVSKLVYYEMFMDPENAIRREKQIKGGSRAKKIALIKSINPEFNDLYNSL